MTAARSRTAQMAMLPLLLVLGGLWLARWRTTGRPVALSPQLASPSKPASYETIRSAPPAAAPSLALPARDPFRPPAAVASRITFPQADASTASAGPARLQGILWGVETPRAIVNDRIVGVGESVDGIHIVAITADGVVVEYQGQRAVLRIAPPTPSSSTTHGSR